MPQVGHLLLVELRAAWRAPRGNLELYVQSDNVLGVLPYGSASSSPLLIPVTAHREHPFGNPNPARVMAGVAAQL